MHLRTLYQINERNTRVAEDVHFIMQLTCSGVLTRENYIGVVWTIFEASSKIWIHDSTYHCVDQYSRLKICRNKTYENSAWVIKVTSNCWCFLICRPITFRKTFTVFCCCFGAASISLSNGNFTVIVTPSSCFSCLWTNIVFNFLGWLGQFSVPF